MGKERELISLSALLDPFPGENSREGIQEKREKGETSGQARERKRKSMAEEQREKKIKKRGDYSTAKNPMRTHLNIECRQCAVCSVKPV